MKYTCEIVIESPRDKVVELFDSTDNLFKWMEGLKSFEHLEGEPGQPGAKSRLVFKRGSGDLEMIETVAIRDLPDVFAGSYEADHAWNGMVNRFVEEGADRTRWTTENEFKFTGIWRFVSLVLRPMFPKQTMKSMRAFKEFVEAEGE